LSFTHVDVRGGTVVIKLTSSPTLSSSQLCLTFPIFRLTSCRECYGLLRQADIQLSLALQEVVLRPGCQACGWRGALSRGSHEPAQQVNPITQALLTYSLSVTHSLSFGFFGDFSDLLTLYFKVEKAHYADAVAWVRDLIAGSIFSKERCVTFCTIAYVQTINCSCQTDSRVPSAQAGRPHDRSSIR
jgi:hypothetical protein